MTRSERLGNPGIALLVGTRKGAFVISSGEFRIVSDAKFRVFRSRNGGCDWEALTNGLPQRNAYLHCMREGIAVDSLDPCGIYVGTTNGQIFYSRNEGDSWDLMIDNLPPINSLEVAQT